jgi:hypothetical protein
MVPFFWLLCAHSTWAQSVQFRASEVRVTVPLNTINTHVITNLVNVEDVVTPVNLEVAGLPAGAGYTLSTNGLLTNALLDLTLNTTNIAPGEHTFSLNANGGAINNLSFVLQAGYLWNGSTNAASDGAGNWSDPAKWLGGGVPGAGDDVIFTDLGGQSNSSVIVPDVSTNTLVSSVVDVDTTIGSLRFAQTNADTAFHTIQLNPGRTLSITGSNGFRFLRDYVADNSEAGFPTFASLTATIIGTNATMVVSNIAANVALLIEAQAANTLDLSRLDRFVVDVNRVGLGDYSLYPNFWNLEANEYDGVPRRFVPSVNFARTNIIRATYADPNGYTNADSRQYSLTFVNSVYSGTTQIPVWNLGITNAFFADSVCLVGANQQGRVQFNPGFGNSNNATAYFRGTNGGRMSMFAISDDAGTNYSSSNIKSFIDFGGNSGTVDVLADRFYMTRDRKRLSSDGNFQGELYLGQGSIDVNTAVLGFQEFANRSTSNTVFRGYCQASMWVSNTAVFKVNGNLELGYGADTNPLSEPFNTRGIINVGPGGTVMASNILFGGITKLSSQSAINLNNGGNLIVSNAIAGPDAKLPAINLNTGGKLTLHVDGSRTDPYVFVTNLVTSGSGNVLEIASVVNVSTFPAEIALVSYESASASLSVTVPSGLFGFLVNDSVNKLIKLILSASSPKTVLWRGNVDANWDTTTLNWLDAATLTPTNFNQGDFAVFDDTALATNITVVSALITGQHATNAGVTVSNVTRHFTFSGNPGDIIAGTGRMLKQGTGTLTVDVASENPLTINEGLVNGSGAIGAAIVTATGTLDYSGAMAGLTATGKVTLASSGTINGPVSIFGGSFENSGAVDTRPGTMVIGPDSRVTNHVSGNLKVFVASGNNWAVQTNAVLANFGRIENLNQRLNINAGGLLFGTGVLGRAPGVTADNGRLAINAGAVFAPGASPFNSIGVFSVEARLDVNQAGGGSPAGKLVIEVDLNHPAVNDVVAVDKWSNVRGTIVMTNLGTVPFGAGQSFLVASNNFGSPNTPEVANLDYTFDPFVPGVGLVWDVFNRFSTGGSNFLTNGIVAIKAIPIQPTNVVFSTFANTNLVLLSWPAEYLGWRVEGQTNSVAVGLSTNWGNLPNSYLTNQVYTRINPTNGAVFFRMVHP